MGNFRKKDKNRRIEELFPPLDLREKSTEVDFNVANSSFSFDVPTKSM